MPRSASHRTRCPAILHSIRAGFLVFTTRQQARVRRITHSSDILATIASAAPVPGPPFLLRRPDGSSGGFGTGVPGQISQRQMLMLTEIKLRRNSQAGITMIETLMATFILLVGSLGMIGLIISSIATNNRNKLDSTQTMLASSIVEQINSTTIGTEQSDLSDCVGVSHTIATAVVR